MIVAVLPAPAAAKVVVVVTVDGVTIVVVEGCSVVLVDDEVVEAGRNGRVVVVTGCVVVVVGCPVVVVAPSVVVLEGAVVEVTRTRVVVVVGAFVVVVVLGAGPGMTAIVTDGGSGEVLPDPDRPARTGRSSGRKTGTFRLPPPARLEGRKAFRKESRPGASSGSATGHIRKPFRKEAARKQFLLPHGSFPSGRKPDGNRAGAAAGPVRVRSRPCPAPATPIPPPRPPRSSA